MLTKDLHVCFTGAAYGPNCEPILRADLKAAVTAMGMIVHDNFCNATEVLVASRADTSKALKAATRGIKVMSYPHFLHTFQVHVRPGNQAHRDVYVDTHQKQPSSGLFGGNEL